MAAARPRARCVLADGCPVLRVHRSLGCARHIGQRTDKMCRSVRVSGFTLTLFNIAHLRDGQSCSQEFQSAQNGNLRGTDLSWADNFADDQSSMVQTSPASTPASFALRKRRRIPPDLVFGNPRHTNTCSLASLTPGKSQLISPARLPAGQPMPPAFRVPPSSRARQPLPLPLNLHLQWS